MDVISVEELEKREQLKKLEEKLLEAEKSLANGEKTYTIEEVCEHLKEKFS